MPEVDAALGEYAAFAVELAKLISTTNIYYAKDDWKNDKLAQGKVLHKKLLEAFGKLDAMNDKLGAAVLAWRTAHPADLTKMEEGEKVAMPSIDAARAIVVLLGPAKKDLESFKQNEAKLATALEPLRAFAKAHEGDVWARVLLPVLEDVAKRAKEAEPKLTEKGLEADPFLALVASYVTVLEARQRAHMQAVGGRPGVFAPGLPGLSGPGILAGSASPVRPMPTPSASAAQ